MTEGMITKKGNELRVGDLVQFWSFEPVKITHFMHDHAKIDGNLHSARKVCSGTQWCVRVFDDDELRQAVPCGPWIISQSMKWANQ